MLDGFTILCNEVCSAVKVSKAVSSIINKVSPGECTLIEKYISSSDCMRNNLPFLYDGDTYLVKTTNGEKYIFMDIEEFAFGAPDPSYISNFITVGKYLEYLNDWHIEVYGTSILI